MGDLDGDRVTLRPMVLDDARAMADLLEDDEEAASLTSRIPVPCDEAGARSWIASSGEHTFAVVRREDGRFVGAVGLTHEGPRVGLGCWIGRPYWNRGYAAEAVSLVLDHARRIGVRSVEAVVLPENSASARVLTKLGFEVIGETFRDVRGARRRMIQHVLDPI